MSQYKTLFRIFSFSFVITILFLLNNTLWFEEWFKICPSQWASCSPNQCRTDPDISYSTNSNWWTVRDSNPSRYINWYSFDKWYPTDSSDQVIANLFMWRYWLSSSSPRQVQQKINQLALNYSSKWCTSTCEDWRFGNDTISKMAICLCVDADENPNSAWECPDWFQPDSKNCCICAEPNKSPINNSCSTWFILQDKCCVPLCESQSKITPDSTWQCPDPEIYKLEDSCCVLTTCNQPRVIIWSECKCPDDAIYTNWSCCKWEPPNMVCTCPASKIRDESSNSCVCPPWKIDKWDGKCVCDPSKWCCGIQLNTVVPFIWDCIEIWISSDSKINPINAFPKLMWSLSRITITAVLIFSFLLLVIWWVMIVSWWIKKEAFDQWRDIIWKVVAALILLWASWIILRLINPNFFG